MDEVFGNLRQIVIHDVRDAVDVNAAGGYVGGDQHAVIALLESGQGLVALALGAVAMDARGVDAFARQLFRQAVGSMLGAGENQERAGLGFEQLAAAG